MGGDALGVDQTDRGYPVVENPAGTVGVEVYPGVSGFGCEAAFSNELAKLK